MASSESPLIHSPHTVVWLLLQYHLYGLRQQPRVYLQTLYCFKHLYSGLFQSRLPTLPGRGVSRKIGISPWKLAMKLLLSWRGRKVFFAIWVIHVYIHSWACGSWWWNSLDPGYSLEPRCFSFGMSIRTNLNLTSYATSVCGSVGKASALKVDNRQFESHSR